MTRSSAQAGPDDLRAKVWTVFERLRERYGERTRTPPRRDAMRELVSTMLSHRTTHANEELAYERMLEAFPSWEAVRDAPEAELAHALRSAKFPEVKAKNVKVAVERILAERGEAKLDFLADLSPEDGLAWLMRLPGVGLKTASLVLLFNFGKSVLPVDTHVHRVSGRLGLIPAKMSAERAHGALQALLPEDAEVLYTFHVTMLRHGQQLCVWGRPHCEPCPLKDLCDWYAEHEGRESESRSARG